MLTQDGITIPQDKITLGQDVKATLTAVAAGDADAAIVYMTDAKAAGNTITEVPIAALAERAGGLSRSRRSRLRRTRSLPTRGSSYVLSPAGQKTLAKFGFLPVPPTT